MSKQRIAIVPGSFDPITKGHVSIIKKAVEAYDKVYVAVMINDQKTYMFSLDERRQIAEACLKKLPTVTVISSDGMLWELAKSLGACAIVKGYRNEYDLEYEQKMAEFNSAHYPEAETVLIRSDDGMEHISSTLARKNILEKTELFEYLPEEAIEAVREINSIK